MHCSLLILFFLISCTARALPSKLINGSHIHVEDLPAGKQCTVYPNGNGVNDVPNILDAFALCGNNGKVVFPEGEDYCIASKLNPVFHNVTIEWRGTWTMSADIHYWRQTQNHYPIRFQNHSRMKSNAELQTDMR